MNRLGAAIFGGALAGAVAVAGFSPLVRYEAAEALGRYGATAEIESVSPTWSGVRLRGVSVLLPEVPSAKVWLDEVEIAIDGSGARRVAFRGGSVRLVGDPGRIATEVEAWREVHMPASSGGEPSVASGLETEVSGISVLWQDSREAPLRSVSAKNVLVSRSSKTIAVSASETTLGWNGAKGRVVGGSIALSNNGAGYRVALLEADSVSAELALPSAEASPGDVSPEVPVVPSPSPLARPSAASLRDGIVAAARLATSFLEPDARVELGGVQVLLRRGDQSLNLGPGIFSLTQEADRLSVSLSPRGGAKAEPTAADTPSDSLTFALSVPLESGSDAGEIIADLRGGPIGLAALGVRDGDFGLAEVGATSIETTSHLVLSANGKGVRFEGTGRVKNLSLTSDALSDEPVLGLELAFRGKVDAATDGSRVTVADGELDLGTIALHLSGTYERSAEHYKVDAKYEIPLTACQSMLDSLPAGLVRRLQGVRMAGSYAIKGKARFDTARIDRDFDVDWDASNTCRVVDVPRDIDVEHFRHPFRRKVLSPEGAEVDNESGPGTPSWTSWAAISPFMATAVQSTEDAAFYRHRGFDELAIKSAIRDNLKKGQFYRGASTVTMQLAKNIYLDRKKNVSRKLQEAVLTMYLEQALTKEEIMELYLNVVELGPLVYGVGPAARYYFNASPSQLSLSQSLYLSSILPSPSVQHFGASGVVTPGWTRYLRKVMKNAHKRHRIDDEQLELGLRETVVRGSPSPMVAPAPDEAQGGGSAGEGDEPPPDEAY